MALKDKQKPANRPKNGATTKRTAKKEELSAFQKATLELYESAAYGLPPDASETKLRYFRMQEGK